MRFSDLPISCGPHLIQNFHEDELGLDVPNLSTLSLFRQPPREQAQRASRGQTEGKGESSALPGHFPAAAQKAPGGAGSPAGGRGPMLARPVGGSSFQWYLGAAVAHTSPLAWFGEAFWRKTVVFSLT